MIRILAQEVVEESSGIDLLLPDTSELIAGFIAFSIIFVFVWKWVIPAADKALTARQEAITGQLTQAETAKQEAESLLDDYKKQLAQAKSEANTIVEDARQAADVLRSNLVGQAEEDAVSIRGKARADAGAEMDRAAAQIKDEVATLSLELAQMVVAGSVDESVQRTLVDRYIDDLGNLPS
ncbi:MAG: F0F1 ATP synthase subunit B [Acidobacteria bacterium]|nr:F0F1 ATP synthase subunit B [Acidobacteriota bacterium]